MCFYNHNSFTPIKTYFTASLQSLKTKSGWINVNLEVNFSNVLGCAFKRKFSSHRRQSHHICPFHQGGVYLSIYSLQLLPFQLGHPRLPITHHLSAKRTCLTFLTDTPVLCDFVQNVPFVASVCTIPPFLVPSEYLTSASASRFYWKKLNSHLKKKIHLIEDPNIGLTLGQF